MLRLVDLDAYFLKLTDPDGRSRIIVDSIGEAQGVSFLCPLCFTRNGRSSVGVHRVVCWSRSRGVPEHVSPGPGRWALAGTSVADLTLWFEPPSQQRSIRLTSGCRWHDHVTHGYAGLGCDGSDPGFGPEAWPKREGLFAERDPEHENRRFDERVGHLRFRLADLRLRLAELDRG